MDVAKDPLLFLKFKNYKLVNVCVYIFVHVKETVLQEILFLEHTTSTKIKLLVKLTAVLVI